MNIITEKNLKQLREEIDELDRQFITLLSKRAKLAEAVGKYKAEHGIQPLDNRRWREVLDSRMELGKKVGLSTAFIRELFEAIHQHSLSTQKAIAL